MLEEYLPKDICDIIKSKLTTDYVKYQFWCSIEVRWVYLWTECKILNTGKCPHCNKHQLYYIRVTSRIEANGRILKFDNFKDYGCNITRSDFEIINI